LRYLNEKVETRIKVEYKLISRVALAA